MGDIFEEVEESLRRDRAARLWARISPFVFGGAVLLVAGVAAWEGARYLEARRLEREAAAYAEVVKLLESDDLAGARGRLVEIASGKTGFSALASQVLPEVERRLAQDPTAAIDPLQRAVDTQEGVFADLSRLKLAYARADGIPGSELDALIAPLVEKGGLLGSLARELSAAKALAEGDAVKARRIYQALSLQLELPDGLRQRVQQALVIIPETDAAEAGAPPAPAPAAASGASGTPAPAGVEDPS